MRAANLERYLRTAGVTIILALLASREILNFAPFDTGLRGLGHGAFAASGILTIAWVPPGAIFAAFRWQSTTALFRLILILNTGLALFLVLAA